MRVLFYQLSHDPAEVVVPLLAQKTLAAGERMLVVSGDDAQLAAIGEMLWQRPGSFLAHGLAGSPAQERQPVLLSDDVAPVNGATFVVMADGQWRDAALRFKRAFLLFGEAAIESARKTWQALDERDDVEREYWRQEVGKWVKAA
jgi:DNA polymerase-3 subunit chi